MHQGEHHILLLVPDPRQHTKDKHRQEQARQCQEPAPKRERLEKVEEGLERLGLCAKQPAGHVIDNDGGVHAGQEDGEGGDVADGDGGEAAHHAPGRAYKILVKYGSFRFKLSLRRPPKAAANQTQLMALV